MAQVGIKTVNSSPCFVASFSCLLQLRWLSVHRPCLHAVDICQVKQKPSLNIDTTHAREHSVNAASMHTATQDWACHLDQRCSVTSDHF